MEREEIKVLLVEDDPDDALLIREMLAEAQDVRFRVASAGRLADALALLGREGADVMLLDLGLPDSVGFETFLTVHARAPEMPILVLTGLDDRSVGLQAMREGAQDYLVKGRVDADLLVRSVRYAIERKRLELRLAHALEQLDRQFQTIADVQAALLPSEVPRLRGFDIATYYRPAQRAGGDYFDFFPLPDGRLGVLLADVSGHGAHAAVLMAMTRVIAHAPGDKTRPAHVLAELNARLGENIPRGQFVAACYGLVDPEKMTLTFSVAGQPEPIHLDPSRREPQFLSVAPATALGILPGTRFPEASVALAPASVLLFYTDGIIEALNSSGEDFGQVHLAEVVSAHREADAEAICDAILDALAAHCELEGLTDDVTLVVVRALPEQDS